MLVRPNLSSYGGSVWGKLCTDTELIRRLSRGIDIDIVAGNPCPMRMLCLYHRISSCGICESGVLFNTIEEEPSSEMLRLFSYRSDGIEHALAIEYFYELTDQHGFRIFTNHRDSRYV